MVADEDPLVLRCSAPSTLIGFPRIHSCKTRKSKDVLQLAYLKNLAQHTGSAACPVARVFLKGKNKKKGKRKKNHKKKKREKGKNKN